MMNARDTELLFEYMERMIRGIEKIAEEFEYSNHLTSTSLANPPVGLINIEAVNAKEIK